MLFSNVFLTFQLKSGLQMTSWGGKNEFKKLEII